MSSIGIDVVKTMLNNKKFDVVTECATIQHGSERKIIINEYAGKDVRLFKNDNGDVTVLYPKTADVVMEGNLWLDCLGETAAGSCSFYLLMFIEQINQINRALSKVGYEVRLTDFGTQKVKAIKTVRELTGWGLKEAKTFVDAVPNAVLKVGSREEAIRYCEELANIGALAEIA